MVTSGYVGWYCNTLFKIEPSLTQIVGKRKKSTTTHADAFQDLSRLRLQLLPTQKNVTYPWSALFSEMGVRERAINTFNKKRVKQRCET